MITKIKIKDLFKWFGDNHEQVNDNAYYVNHLWEVDKDLANLGVNMIVSSIQSPVSGNLAKYSYEVFLMDAVNIKEDNSAEIESDTFSIALDLISFFDQYDYQTNEVFSLDKNVTSIEPFREKFDSQYAGNILRMTLNIPFNYNTCQIPYK